MKSCTNCEAHEQGQCAGQTTNAACPLWQPAMSEDDALAQTNVDEAVDE